MTENLRVDSKGRTRLLLSRIPMEVRRRLAARSAASGISQAELCRMGIQDLLDKLDEADSQRAKPSRGRKRRAEK
jgi:hypothetical protein